MTDQCNGQRIFRVAAIVPLLITLLLGGCKRPPVPPRPSDTTPKMRATIVTVRTLLQPANQTFTHTIVIADGRARISNDVDAWRLIDFARQQVTFIDEIRKTSRVEPFAAILARRRQEIARPLPEGSPHAQFAPTGARRTIAGVVASEWVLRVGAYERHLWIGRHPSIPDDLFAMLQASGSASSPLSGLARPAEEAFLKTPGFPMADHAELPYGNGKLVVDQSVISVEQRDVPQSWLSVPAADRALSTAPAPIPPVAAPVRR